VHEYDRFFGKISVHVIERKKLSIYEYLSLIGTFNIWVFKDVEGNNKFFCRFSGVSNFTRQLLKKCHTWQVAVFCIKLTVVVSVCYNVKILKTGKMPGI
jgi:hypothetical protein